ncbi:MAG: hypothetical protein AB1505_16285 [Candidatus Latescibacterota bacterium]
MMISPAQWRRHPKPRYACLFQAARRRGRLVWFALFAAAREWKPPAGAAIPESG